jgi:PhnB protein
MQVFTNLTFDGDCAEAFAFYARILGATVTFSLRYGDSPMAGDVPDAWRDKIAHSTLTLPDGTRIYGTDSAPGTYEPPRGFSLTVNPVDVEQAHATFDALAEGGGVTMPLQPTFWAAAFGTLVDRFGIIWAINCEAQQSARTVPRRRP